MMEETPIPHTNTLYLYLEKEHYISDLSKVPLEQANQQVLLLIQQKDATIKNLSQDLNKIRCENIRLNKTTKQLQDKLSVNAGNNNNTGSSFMMASEFKSKFENFMKQTLSNGLSCILHKPKTYTQLAQKILQIKYKNLEHQIEKTVVEVCSALKLVNSSTDELEQTVKKKVFLQLLKIFQDNCEKIFETQEQTIKKSIEDHFGKRVKSLKQVLDSPDFNNILKQLHALVLYMLLQENKWELVIPEELQTSEFVKKEFTCIDGWVKEKDEVYMILEALKKQGTGENKEGVQNHPNLKNFVIPVAEEYESSMESSRHSSICIYREKNPSQYDSNSPKEQKPREELDKETYQIKTEESVEETNVNTQGPPAELAEADPKQPENCTNLQIHQLKISPKIQQQLESEREAIRSRVTSFNKWVTECLESDRGEPVSNSTNLAIVRTNLLPTPLLSHSSAAANQITDCKVSQESRKKKIGVGKIANLFSDPSFTEMLVFPKQRKLQQPPALNAHSSKVVIEDEHGAESRIINKDMLNQSKKTKRQQNFSTSSATLQTTNNLQSYGQSLALMSTNHNNPGAASLAHGKSTRCANIVLHRRQGSQEFTGSAHTSNKSIGKIVHQSARLHTGESQTHQTQNTQSSHEPESHTQRLMRLLGSENNSQFNNKQNHNHNNLLYKENIYKEIMKNRVTKEDRTSSVYRLEIMGTNSKKNSNSNLVVGYNGIKTQRSQGGEYAGTRREENRPCKPSIEHIARFRDKHHLL